MQKCDFVGSILASPFFFLIWAFNPCHVGLLDLRAKWRLMQLPSKVLIVYLIFFFSLWIVGFFFSNRYFSGCFWSHESAFRWRVFCSYYPMPSGLFFLFLTDVRRFFVWSHQLPAASREFIMATFTSRASFYFVGISFLGASSLQVHTVRLTCHAHPGPPVSPSSIDIWWYNRVHFSHTLISRINRHSQNAFSTVFAGRRYSSNSCLHRRFSRACSRPAPACYFFFFSASLLCAETSNSFRLLWSNVFFAFWVEVIAEDKKSFLFFFFIFFYVTTKYSCHAFTNSISSRTPVDNVLFWLFDACSMIRTFSVFTSWWLISLQLPLLFLFFPVLVMPASWDMPGIQIFLVALARNTPVLWPALIFYATARDLDFVCWQILLSFFASTLHFFLWTFEFQRD